MDNSPIRASKQEIAAYVKQWLGDHKMKRSDLARELKTTRAVVSSWTLAKYYPDAGKLYQAALKREGDLCEFAKHLLNMMGYETPEDATLDCSQPDAQ